MSFLLSWENEQCLGIVGNLEVPIGILLSTF